MNVILLGLPGLYQNWLMAAVDKDSYLQLHGDKNFFCSKSIVKWMIKNELNDYPVASNDLLVLNLVVKEHNMPWYLYNLFEKTYDIKIMIDTFVEDLMDKGDQFSIFAGFKRNLSKLNFNDQNEVIFYFYDFFVSKDHSLYKDCQTKSSSYINIEYDDFNQKEVLIKKLSAVPTFSESHFENLHNQLVERNQRYLNRKKDFITKLENNIPLDVLELGYVGYLVNKIYNKDPQWKNENIRNATLKYKINEIIDAAKTLL